MFSFLYKRIIRNYEVNIIALILFVKCTMVFYDIDQKNFRVKFKKILRKIAKQFSEKFRDAF